MVRLQNPQKLIQTLTIPSDVQKVPKEIGAKAALKRSQETKMIWLHAVCVVLATVDQWADFIYNRQEDFESSESFLYFF